MQDAAIDEILTLWFGDEPTPNETTRARWWTKDPAFDALLRERFGELLERGARGALDPWLESARGTLALVILLDQFSRNVHRGTPASFAQDERALAIAERAIETGIDQELPLDQRYFLYMPLMHAEDVEAQRRCVRCFESLVAASEGEARARFESGVDFARRHMVIVERFGRFPHRNAILGRPSSAEEEAFLQTPGSSF